jgi:(1->4)-alpha-D-glucan 1-alpha-D-glucosylmutase
MNARPAARPPSIPAATYRLQLNRCFTFADAAGLVNYLAELGVSDCYVSPVLAARSGSLHGYDVVRHDALNPELGGEAAFAPFAEALRSRGLGLLVDIVPNHMGIADPGNAWWQDLLANGPASACASCFDIDWATPRPGLAGKVLLPVLGGPFGEVLAAGELLLALEDGGLFLRYFDHRFPLSPQSWPRLLRPAGGRLRRRAGADASLPAALSRLGALLDELQEAPALSPAGPGVRRPPRSSRLRLATWQRLLGALLATHPALDRALRAELGTFNRARRSPRGMARLEALLDAQHYRLCHWRPGIEGLNYRRFFDVNDLAGLRVEEARVFQATHRLLFRLVQRDWVTGFRVDHPDGLYDPERYFARLQAGCRAALAAGGREDASPEPSRPFYVVAEKILSGEETLPPAWAVHGTTGYEFLARLNGLFVAEQNGRAFRQLYARFSGVSGTFSRTAYECRRHVLEWLFPAELERITLRLEGIAEQHRDSRDFSRANLRVALLETIASFPVYRTYVTARGVSPEDRAVVRRALAEARRRNPRQPGAVFDFLGRVLALEHPPGLDRAQRRERVDFVQRFQQLTGPVVAKGVEDTALYRFFPLASLNVVGGDPERFGEPLDAFHRWVAERQRLWPHGLSATSTHDTKRSEDVRARLNVLSEMPELWERAVLRWRAFNRHLRTPVHGRPAPDHNEEYLLYQMLVGAWPLGGSPLRKRGGGRPAGQPWTDFPARIQGYMEKALREAKQHTSWIEPNARYEAAVSRFVAEILRPVAANRFLADLEGFLPAVVRAGLYNGLSQTLLNIVLPGVPDFYQGSELWDFSLVDPDNRQPVDFERRRALLARVQALAAQDSAAGAEALLREPEDGAVKLFLIHQGLSFRRTRPALFAYGAYLPLTVQGRRQSQVVALARLLPDAVAPRQAVLAAAGRFFLTAGLPHPPIGEAAWGDTRLVLPEALALARFRCVLTGRTVSALSEGGAPCLPLPSVFRHLPVALLELMA